MYTNISKDLTLAGMAGVVSLTSSVNMEIGPSPRRLIVSTMGSLSSRDRKAVIQVFMDSTTNVPPKSAPMKWWKPNSRVVPPNIFHPLANVYLPLLRPFPS